MNGPAGTISAGPGKSWISGRQPGLCLGWRSRFYVGSSRVSAYMGKWLVMLPTNKFASIGYILCEIENFMVTND